MSIFLSGCRSGQARYFRRAAFDNGCVGTMIERPAGDLVLPSEPDALLALRVGKETVEGANPAGVAGDAVVQADNHHTPPMWPFLVKLVELIAQRLLLGGRMPALEREGDDVVHVEGVRNGHKVPSAHRDDERFVVARLVDVIEETEILQRLQDVNGVAHPICVPAELLLAGDLLDRLDAVGDKAFFLIARESVRIVPNAAVGGSLMTAAHDLP